MSCATCDSFDPNYHNGYCNYHHCDTSPDSTCSKEDSNGGGFTKRTCSTCDYFDSSFHGGYCDYHKIDVYSSSSCSDYED